MGKKLQFDGYETKLLKEWAESNRSAELFYPDEQRAVREMQGEVMQLESHQHAYSVAMDIADQEDYDLSEIVHKILKTSEDGSW